MHSLTDSAATFGLYISQLEFTTWLIIILIGTFSGFMQTTITMGLWALVENRTGFIDVAWRSISFTFALVIVIALITIGCEIWAPTLGAPISSVTGCVIAYFLVRSIYR